MVVQGKFLVTPQAGQSICRARCAVADATYGADCPLPVSLTPAGEPSIPVDTSATIPAGVGGELALVDVQAGECAESIWTHASELSGTLRDASAPIQAGGRVAGVNHSSTSLSRVALRAHTGELRGTLTDAGATIQAGVGIAGASWTFAPLSREVIRTCTAETSVGTGAGARVLARVRVAEVYGGLAVGARGAWRTSAGVFRVGLKGTRAGSYACV